MLNWYMFDLFLHFLFCSVDLRREVLDCSGRACSSKVRLSGVCLSFLICEMEIIIVPISYDGCDDRMR